ncbi:MipA/OmpV family protein [Zophobihabitans entericus]|uniref:MipA/OmpV family protein n=1 Tax=Zophobihabitans entericus TaxID=1635327 RepID=A0A6G9I8L1_9GAMM|nr:MipA/OmpV family protein [Zophobihabitans entericus]QIQ20553.1 MipA/OmpV family protein [Zophobihabitans entericus]
MRFLSYKSTITLASILAVTFPVASFAQTGEEAESSFSLGAGIAVQPKYMGSNKVEAGPIIHAAYDLGYGFFASTTDGLGFGYSHEIYPDINLLAGTAFNYRMERKDKDELKGMGKVKGSLMNTIKFGIDIKSYVTLSIGANIALTEHDNGSNYFISVDTPLYQTDKDDVMFSTTAYYFDSKYSQTYFGVTDKQSGTSQYRKYTPGSGFGQIDAGVLWSHQFSPQWSTVSYAGVSHLIGDAADSPIAKRKTAPVAAFAVIYNF